MIVFATVKSITGAASTNPRGVEGAFITVVVHAPSPTTNAVFDTAVSTQTTPTTPVIVNVHACPSPKLNPLPDHPNNVPDATLVTVGAPNAPG